MRDGNARAVFLGYIANRRETADDAGYCFVIVVLFCVRDVDVGAALLLAVSHSSYKFATVVFKRPVAFIIN